MHSLLAMLLIEILILVGELYKSTPQLKMDIANISDWFPQIYC